MLPVMVSVTFADCPEPIVTEADFLLRPRMHFKLPTFMIGVAGAFPVKKAKQRQLGQRGFDNHLVTVVAAAWNVTVPVVVVKSCCCTKPLIAKKAKQQHQPARA